MTSDNEGDEKGLSPNAITPEFRRRHRVQQRPIKAAESENEEQDAEGLEAGSEGGRQSKADKRRNRRKKRRGKKRKAAHAAVDDAERDGEPETGTEDMPATNDPNDDHSIESHSEPSAEGMRPDDAMVSDSAPTAAIEESNALAEPSDEAEDEEENAELPTLQRRTLRQKQWHLRKPLRPTPQRLVKGKIKTKGIDDPTAGECHSAERGAYTRACSRHRSPR